MKDPFKTAGLAGLYGILGVAVTAASAQPRPLLAALIGAAFGAALSIILQAME